MFLLGIVLPLGVANAKPGKLTINCWEFNRGNAKVMDNPAKYGDYRDKHPDLMLIAGDEKAWFVEYDLEFPASGTYSVRTRFASAGEYPLDVLIDGKRVGQICLKETGNNPPYFDLKPNVFEEGTPIRKWHLHGVEWEESCKIEVTKGKHTLKLMRNGPPANPIKIELSADGPAVKRINPPDPDVVLARIPVRYRNVFLFRDGDGRSVNVEGLRVAIKDHIKSFGPKYPRGAQYLKELEALEKRDILAKKNASPEQKQELKDAWVALRKKALLDNPKLKFDKLLFVSKKYVGASTYTAQKHHYYKPGERLGNICLLSPVSADGKVTELVPELNGGVFGRFDLSFDASKIVFGYSGKEKHYRIYEIDVDPKTGRRAGGDDFRQLTFSDAEEARTMQSYQGSHCAGGFEDLDPVYLPSGKIMFCSTRSQRSVLCNPTTVTTLHVMDADGKNITCISQGQVNEMSPSVLDDGRVVYMRWEYVDKGFGNVQSLWAVRPDGSHSDHVFKNDLVCPGTMIHARSIPNSRKIVATAAAHHGGMHGPIVVIDNRRNRRFTDGLDNLTPEIRYGGLFPKAYRPYNRTGVWRDPYPLSEKLFLASHQPALKFAKGAEFGLYVLDVWGNRAELLRDKELSCLEPMPFRPRPVPIDITPVIATPEKKQQQLATMFMSDVYQGLPDIERGRVKYVRVMEAMNLGWLDTWRACVQGDGGGYQQISMVSAGGDVAKKYVHGLATVYEDGSAAFTVPPNKNLFFQALDENHMELHRMRTFINLMPGENRSCVGCHEFRRKAPGLRTKAQPIAMAKGALPLYPQPGDTGPRAVHYPLDVQPILDKHCISCHSGETPKGGLHLTGEPEGKYFTRSYMALTHFDNKTKKRLISYLWTSNFGGAHVPLEPPMSFGSHRSKMVERIRKDPCKGKLTKEEFIKIVTWIDANAPFYGTHNGKKNIKWKDDPDFRPMPTVVKASQTKSKTKPRIP